MGPLGKPCACVCVCVCVCVWSQIVLLSLGVSGDVSKLGGGSNVALVSSYYLCMSSAAKISELYKHAANMYKENSQQNKQALDT